MRAAVEPIAARPPEAGEIRRCCSFVVGDARCSGEEDARLRHGFTEPPPPSLATAMGRAERGEPPRCSAFVPSAAATLRREAKTREKIIGGGGDRRLPTSTIPPLPSSPCTAGTTPTPHVACYCSTLVHGGERDEDHRRRNAIIATACSSLPLMEPEPTATAATHVKRGRRAHCGYPPRPPSHSASSALAGCSMIHHHREMAETLGAAWTGEAATLASYVAEHGRKKGATGGFLGCWPKLLIVAGRWSVSSPREVYERRRENGEKGKVAKCLGC
nr:hypothetical protein Iba_chr11cCG11810 [Ipomoea batatas]